MRNAVISIILIGALITVSYFAYKKLSKTQSATPEQFKKLVSISNSTGKDVFQDLDERKMKELEEKYTSNLSREDMNDLIFIFSKKERDLTKEEMVRLKNYFFRATGKSMVS